MRGVTILGLIFATPSLAIAQAWIRNPGHAYANLYYRFIAADQFYGPDGKRTGIADYRQHSLGFYTELGVIEQRLMLTLDGELFRKNVLVDQGTTYGVGDI